jgi:hypothetical protein
MLFFLPSSNCAYHGEEYSLKVSMDEPAFFLGRNKWNILSHYFPFSGKNLQFFLNYLEKSHHIWTLALVW